MNELLSPEHFEQLLKLKQIELQIEAVKQRLPYVITLNGEERLIYPEDSATQEIM
jgi:hypothetical protein